MKEDSFKPVIDRSKKQNALKAHEQTKSAMELLEEKGKLLDRSIQNEQEQLNLEKEIKNIVVDKENENSTQQEQQLMYHLWELQAKQNDFAVEEKSIDEQIDKSKDVVKDQDKTKMQQIEEDVKIRKYKMQKLKEEREKAKREREEFLKRAREMKPENLDHRIPPKTQRKNELILSPKTLNNVITPSVPTFDRSAKPAVTARHIYNEEDFSPVYGKVVS
jgi:hypothetical protein